MGLRYGVSQAESQTKSINAECDREIEAYEKTITALKKFNSDTELTGQTYQSAKKYCMSVIVPLAQGMIEVNEEIKRLNNKYKNKYRNEVATVSVDEDKLTGQINELRRSIKSTQEISNNLPIAKPALQQSINVMGTMENRLREKLEHLYQFNNETRNGFSGIKESISRVNAGFKQLESHKSFDSSTGTFSTDGMDMGIFVGLSDRYNNMIFCEKYGVERPKNMTDAEFAKYVSSLRKHVTELESDGWNKAAIKGYISYLKKSIKGLKGTEILTTTEELNKQCFVVGSKAFLSLMNSAFPNTQEGQKKTLKMVYKILGATIDENGFLQLTNMKLFDGDAKGKYSFTTDIMDAIGFDRQFSKIVQGAYPDGLAVPHDSIGGIGASGLLVSNLANQTHQFRYYLDYKNNIALRKTYPNAKSDMERLRLLQMDLVAKYGWGTSSFLTGEKARYHNKYQGDYQKFIKKYGMNHKFVTSPNFHSEWIIDKNGNLVSQWNAYTFDKDGNVDSRPDKYYSQEQQRQIVDGNSVNYADNSEGYKHDQFDSTPVSQYDPKVRNNISDKWESPGTNSDKSNYFDRKKSTDEANNLLKGD